VGRDPKTDLALVKIDGASDLHPLTLGNSEDLKVGSWSVDFMIFSHLLRGRRGLRGGWIYPLSY